MDTISIINNLDQNVLMENLLILNQKKLLDLVIKVFEEDFKEKIFEDLSIDYVKEYFRELNFINWELFIRLLNLKSTFICEQRNSRETQICDYCSLMYLIRKGVGEKKSTKLIEILLELPKGTINWDAKSIETNSNVLMMMIFHVSGFYKNLKIINKIIESDLFDLKIWEEKNIYNRNAIDYLIYSQPEEIIIKFIELKKIKLNKKQLERINSEKIVLYLMDKQDISMDTDIFMLAVENNWINVIDYYFQHGLIEWGHIDGILVVFWLLYYTNYSYAKIAYFNSAKKFLKNLEKEYDIYNLNPYGFD